MIWRISYLAFGILLLVISQFAIAQTPAPTSDTSSDETVPREFLGFTDANTFHGVIDDPDGYVNLRSRSDYDDHRSRWESNEPGKMVGCVEV